MGLHTSVASGRDQASSAPSGRPGSSGSAYLIKLAVYVAGALVVTSVGPGAGGIGGLSSWWAQPLVVQKFVVWTVLWEILGFGAGCGPLGGRDSAPVGGLLHWLRPGTVRLPPWPGWIAFTSGCRRGILDVALYVGVLACGAALLSGGHTDGAAYDTLSRSWLWALLGLLFLLGLRDKTAFLAARPEHYLAMLLVFTAAPGNLVFGMKLCLLGVWWAGAAATLNRQYPYAIAARLCGARWLPAGSAARWAWTGGEGGSRPSPAATRTALGLSAARVLLPLVAITGRGGWPGIVAVSLMLVLHLLALSAPAPGADPEWNLVGGFATVVLFAHFADVGASTLTSVPLMLVLLVLLLVVPLIGAAAPRLVSSAFSMRNGTGNTSGSVWLFRDEDAVRVFEERFPQYGILPPAWQARLNRPRPAGAEAPDGPDDQRLLPYRRALKVLLARAVPDPSRYTVRDGEQIANRSLGWALEDGHLHNDQLVRAVQARCCFTAEQLRVVIVEAQPLRRGTILYRILDAATGKQEEGIVSVRDLLDGPPSSSRTVQPVRIRFQVLPPPPPREPVARPRPRPAVRTAAPVAASAAVRPRPRPQPMLGSGRSA